LLTFGRYDYQDAALGCIIIFHTGGQIMVSGIGSSGSYGLQAMQQNLFKKIDADGSGGISQAELKTLATDINSKTGKTLKIDDSSFTSYDSDGSGTLSSEELMKAMESNGFGPPGGIAGAGEMGSPPATDQAAATYAANSNEDSLTSLIADLQQQLLQLQSETGNQSTSANTSSISKNRPEPQDFFKKVDADGNGTVSKDELTAMAEDLKKMTGQSITVNNDTFASADSNSDGSLNSDELKSFMDKSGFAPPPGGMGTAISNDTSSTKSSETGSSSSKSSNQDQIDLLKIVLEKLTQFSKETESTAAVSLLNVSA
jgi:Ca2+-binding EF-hand superfamily protein